MGRAPWRAGSPSSSWSGRPHILAPRAAGEPGPPPPPPQRHLDLSCQHARVLSVSLAPPLLPRLDWLSISAMVTADAVSQLCGAATGERRRPFIFVPYLSLRATVGTHWCSPKSPRLSTPPRVPHLPYMYSYLYFKGRPSSGGEEGCAACAGPVVSTASLYSPPPSPSPSPSP